MVLDIPHLTAPEERKLQAVPWLRVVEARGELRWFWVNSHTFEIDKERSPHSAVRAATKNSQTAVSASPEGGEFSTLRPWCHVNAAAAEAFKVRQCR